MASPVGGFLRQRCRQRSPLPFPLLPVAMVTRTAALSPVLPSRSHHPPCLCFPKSPPLLLVSSFWCVCLFVPIGVCLHVYVGVSECACLCPGVLSLVVCSSVILICQSPSPPFFSFLVPTVCLPGAHAQLPSCMNPTCGCGGDLSPTYWTGRHGTGGASR